MNKKVGNNDLLLNLLKTYHTTAVPSHAKTNNRIQKYNKEWTMKWTLNKGRTTKSEDHPIAKHSLREAIVGYLEFGGKIGDPDHI